MGTIRTKKLGEGLTDAAGTALLLFTCPAGKHQRIPVGGAHAQSATAIGQVSLYILTSAGNVAQMVQATPGALGTPVENAGWFVLEAGDSVYALAAVGTRNRAYVSGTEYDN